MQPPCPFKEMSLLSLTGIERDWTPTPAPVARPAFRLEELPEELILGIVNRVAAKPEAFVCLSQTCRTFRRICTSVEFKAHHKWQVASLQANWSTYSSGRVPSVTDRRPSWLSSDQNALKSRLGDLLRRDLFCAGCLSPSPRYGVRLPPFLWNSELCQSRPCGHCPGNPEHPGWQFLADGTCLRTAALIRTCPHRTVSAQELWNTRPSASLLGECSPSDPPEHTSCGQCDSHTERLVSGLWEVERSPPYVGLSTDWQLARARDGAGPFAGRGLDGRQRTARLVDRFRLHERLYLCPHHPIDGDRERCITQLAPLVHGFQARLDQEARRRRRGDTFFVRHHVKCVYCGVKVGLQNWPDRPDDLQLYRAYWWRQAPPRSSSDGGSGSGGGSAPWVVNHFHCQPTVAQAALLTAAELPPDYPHARHPRLRHLTWCGDAACATNRRAAHLPVMLARVAGERDAPQEDVVSF